MTETRLSDGALDAQRNALRIGDHSTDQLIAGMGHALRTPLNAILGFTGTLLMRLPGPLTDDQQTQLLTVQSNGKHLLALINDMLDLARLRAGSYPLAIEQVVVQEVADEVAAALRPMAASRGVGCEVRLPQGPMIANSDRRALRQLLMTIGKLAIAGTDHGTIHIAGLAGAWEAGQAIGLTIGQAGWQPTEHAGHEAVLSDRPAPDPLDDAGLALRLAEEIARILGARIAAAPATGEGWVLWLPGS